MSLNAILNTSTGWTTEPLSANALQSPWQALQPAQQATLTCLGSSAQ